MNTPMPADGPAGRRPISRRSLLHGTAAATAGLLGTGLAAGTAHAAGGHTNAPTFRSGSELYVGSSPAARALGPAEKVFDNIDGTPTMYIRGGNGRQPATFRCRNGFYDSLVDWVQRLRSLSSGAGYPGLEFITSAGAYVDKPGQHGNGTAIDVDEIGWTDGRMCRPIGLDWDSSDGALRKRYYALDCTLRAHFRWSLDRTYNAAHHDHIHSDFGGMPQVLGKGSSSDTGFIQALCNEFMNSGLVIDQIWGPLTQGAYEDALSRLNISGNPLGSVSGYQELLDAAAAKGFANQPF